MAGGELKALRDRLRAASGGDRELDIAVGGLWPNPPFNVSDKVFRNAKPVCPFFTASIDAALALCERKLPGRSLLLASPSGVWAAHMPRAGQSIHTAALVEEYDGEPLEDFDHASAPTAPLAILIALLEAMIGKET
jgi:hypothetical protein